MFSYKIDKCFFGKNIYSTEHYFQLFWVITSKRIYYDRLWYNFTLAPHLNVSFFVLHDVDFSSLVYLSFALSCPPYNSSSPVPSAYGLDRTCRPVWEPPPHWCPQSANCEVGYPRRRISLPGVMLSTDINTSGSSCPTFTSFVNSF